MKVTKGGKLGQGLIHQHLELIVGVNFVKAFGGPLQRYAQLAGDINVEGDRFGGGLRSRPPATDEATDKEQEEASLSTHQLRS
jgi:hypothetical protein